MTLGETYPQRIIADLPEARRATVAALLEMRAGALDFNDPGGYDLLTLPTTGETTRVFTKQEFRVDARGLPKGAPGGGANGGGRKGGGSGKAGGRAKGGGGGGGGRGRGRGGGRGGGAGAAGRGEQASPSSSQRSIAAFFQPANRSEAQEPPAQTDATDAAMKE